MKTFIKKVLIHLSIPILFVGYVIYVGFSQNLHITEFPKKRLLIGEPYNENYLKYYKWQTSLDSIDLIAVGSSRVLQFKSEFFSVPFFNLGYLVGTPRQTLELIKAKRIKGKTIIISLDQWAFNTEWSSKQPDFSVPVEPNFLKSCFADARLKDVVTFKVFPTINSRETNILKIGAGANISLDGVINDGSYYYGKIFQGLLTNNGKLVGEDYQFSNTIKRINKGIRRFEYGKVCDQTALDDFEELVKYNIKQGNNVVYFFPPFAPTIQKLIKTDNYSYMGDASTKIAKISNNYNVSFYDFTFLKSTDDMYIDGFHGSAEVYYNIAKSMGLSTKGCIFRNHYETNMEDDLSVERSKFFSSSKLSQAPKSSN